MSRWRLTPSCRIQRFGAKAPTAQSFAVHRHGLWILQRMAVRSAWLLMGFWTLLNTVRNPPHSSTSPARRQMQERMLSRLSFRAGKLTGPITFGPDGPDPLLARALSEHAAEAHRQSMLRPLEELLPARRNIVAGGPVPRFRRATSSNAVDYCTPSPGVGSPRVHGLFARQPDLSDHHPSQDETRALSAPALRTNETNRGPHVDQFVAKRLPVGLAASSDKASGSRISAV